MKKLLIILIVVVMMMSAFGCRNSDDSGTTTTTATTRATTTQAGTTQAGTTSTEPVEEGYEFVELSVISRQVDGGGNYEDVWIWKHLEDKFNVKLNVTQIPAVALVERKAIILASDELADLIIGLNFTTSELVRYGQSEGQLLAYNDLIDSGAMPNLTNWMEVLPEANPLLAAPDGNIYTLPIYATHIGAQTGGMLRLFINHKWLDEVNMDTPETLDELTEVLKAFKAKYPESIPFGGGSKVHDPRHYILNSLGFLTRNSLGVLPSLRDGEVVIPAYTQEYFEYLRILNQYYSEELISKDFFTTDVNTFRAFMAEGKIGISPEPAYLSLPSEADFSSWWAVKPLTSEWNSKKQWDQTPEILIGGLVSSSKANTPVKLSGIARVVDYYYSDEGFVYVWIGPQLDSEEELGIVKGWYFEDGVQKFSMVEDGTFASTFAYGIGKISPYAVSPFGLRAPINRPGVDRTEKAKEMIMPGYVASSEIVFDLTNGDQHYRASVYENLYPYRALGYPSIIYLTEEENQEVSELFSVINPHVEAEIAKFIIGARDLSEFDKFQEELKALGIEKYLQYYVNAFEAFTD